ncbi:NodT family efflux transporter outer membrane factor (OMF) lipoprotein [Bosea sp. BE125]|uniref:efflux transporter outer membrane subunit n=1 Tax=Bosea sp. BE125 TaxID=2817909 RepID=UPI00285D5BCE|nr:efflux transporter outer membrane subunit [Bosea sp. BE125]MDR6869327.1 NodT family efflux transporter outer membrane factor (OMF) lipoprotein [Bosea sp. BE125]
MKRLSLALPLCLALGACAVGPDYAGPSLSLPAKWGNAPASKRPLAAKALDEWWKRLGDKTLNGIVEEAVAGNLDVASAKARIREARATRRQAIGALFPSLDGTGSATRSRTSAATSSTGGNITSSLYQAGFDASWELDLFGANYRGVEAATYGTDAADEDLRATLLTLVGDVTSNYVEARGYQARIALARRTATSQRETEGLTRTKFQAGSASAVDVAKAAAQASSTEAAIPSLEAAYAQSLHQLGILTGQAPTALAGRMARGDPIPAARSTPPAGLPADVLRNRPDVRKAERQLAQYTAKIGQAEAALYPSVSLTGNIATSALKTGDLAKNASIGWSFGPTLSVPIFNGGELRAAVEVAQAQRDQYDSAFRLSVLTAMQDVENALVSLAQERLRSGKLSSAAASYRDAARLSRTLYQSGSSSFLDVLDAERSLYSAEDTLLQSRVAVSTDFIALNKALGGSWTKPVDVSSPAVIDVDTGPHPRTGY